MKEIVKTTDLTKRYGDLCPVNHLDLSVKEGKIYGFLGPNGAGKSTTLKMLLGLVHPTAGEIDLFGQRFTEKSRLSILRDIGSLIESPSYYGHLTAKENLEIDQLADDIGIIANGKMCYQGALSNLHETDRNKSLEQIFLDLTGKDRSL